MTTTHIPLTGPGHNSIFLFWTCCFFSVVLQTGTTQHLSADVLAHCVFSLLPLSSLVSVSMVCRKWRNIASSRVTITKTQANKTAILRSLFEDGASIQFLQWFRLYLQYPSELDTRTNNKKVQEFIVLAAKGLKELQYDRNLLDLYFVTQAVTFTFCNMHKQLAASGSVQRCAQRQLQADISSY
jgi:hypothetical protein